MFLLNITIMIENDYNRGTRYFKFESGVILKSNKNKWVYGILYGVFWGLFSWIIFIRVNTSVVVFDSDMKVL